MKIAVWGLGSIASRHIRNLDAVLRERKIDYQIDVFRHVKHDIEDMSIREIVSDVYEEDELYNQHYDIIFITNPTALHYCALQKCSTHADWFFIEKPVFDRMDADLAALGLIDYARCYVACPLRYTDALQYIRNHVNAKDVISVQAVCSSYLPEWRPETDYRVTYSAHKEMGGGVAIDLIHEWDYLTYLFGFPKKVIHVGGTYSDLQIDSDDLAVYVGIYSDKVIELHLDYFGRKDVRQCRLYLNDDVIVADLLTGCVDYLHSKKHVAMSGERNSYQKRELHHFIDIVEGKVANDNTIDQAMRTLRLTKGII